LNISIELISKSDERLVRRRRREGGEKEIIDEEIQGLSLQRMRRQKKRQEERLWREVVSFLVLKVFSQFHFFSFLFLLCGKRSWLPDLCCLQEG
jgi:hypothetical protein